MDREKIEQVASDEAQKDWDRLEYAGIYRAGFIDGAVWADDEAQTEIASKDAQIRGWIQEFRSYRDGYKEQQAEIAELKETLIYLYMTIHVSQLKMMPDSVVDAWTHGQKLREDMKHKGK